MSVELAIKKSVVSLGNGMYQTLVPVITAEGREAGWYFKYPTIQKNGEGFLKHGETYDSLLAKGFIELELQVCTSF